MSMTVYCLEEIEPTFAEAVVNEFNALPWWAKACAAAVAPVGVVAAVAAGAEIALAAAVICVGGALMGWVSDGDQKLFRVSLGPEEAKKWKQPNNSALDRSTLYAEHPKRSKIAVKTGDYQKLILDEQIAQIIGYIRSKVAVRRLKVEVIYGDESNVEAELGPGKGWFKTEDVSFVGADLSYQTPEIVDFPSEFFWIDQFPQVVNGLQGARRGNATFVQKLSRSVNLGSELAGRVGFAAEATKFYAYRINVTF